MNEFIFPLRVYVEDTDFSGIVYHANYFKYFERARSEWAEQLGFGIDWQEAHKIYFAIRHAEIDYLKPIRLHQQIEVVTRIASARRASIIYDQYLRFSATPDTILCKATIKAVCIDQSLRPTALPTALMNFLGELA